MSSVEYPQMREYVKDALRSLSDRGYQEREWGVFYEDLGRFDDLSLNIHILYDDMAVLPDPETRIGTVLRFGDVEPLKKLGVVLDLMIGDLGDSPDAVYLADPRWARVIAAASNALVVLEEE